MSSKKRGLGKMFSMALCMGFLVGGCAEVPIPPEGILDTPRHHVQSGFKLTEKRYLEDAKREFDLALHRDPRSCSAYRGLALVYCLEKDFEGALKALGEARSYADRTEDKALVHVGYMGLYSLRREGPWLKEVEENFSSALSFSKGLPEAYYQMGVAYHYGKRSSEAAKAFRQVMVLDSRLVPEAERQLRAMENLAKEPGAKEGEKGVSISDGQFRADLAGLLFPGSESETEK